MKRLKPGWAKPAKRTIVNSARVDRSQFRQRPGHAPRIRLTINLTDGCPQRFGPRIKRLDFPRPIARRVEPTRVPRALTRRMTRRKADFLIDLQQGQNSGLQSARDMHAACLIDINIDFTPHTKLRKINPGFN